MLTLQDNVFNIWLVTSFSLVHMNVHRISYHQDRQTTSRAACFFSILTVIVSAFLSAPIDATETFPSQYAPLQLIPAYQ